MDQSDGHVAMKTGLGELPERLLCAVDTELRCARTQNLSGAPAGAQRDPAPGCRASVWPSLRARVWDETSPTLGPHFLRSSRRACPRPRPVLEPMVGTAVFPAGEWVGGPPPARGALYLLTWKLAWQRPLVLP